MGPAKTRRWQVCSEIAADSSPLSSTNYRLRFHFGVIIARAVFICVFVFSQSRTLRQISASWCHITHFCRCHLSHFAPNQSSVIFRCKTKTVAGNDLSASPRPSGCFWYRKTLKAKINQSAALHKRSFNRGVILQLMDVFADAAALIAGAFDPKAGLRRLTGHEL